MTAHDLFTHKFGQKYYEKLIGVWPISQLLTSHLHMLLAYLSIVIDNNEEHFFIKHIRFSFIVILMLSRFLITIGRSSFSKHRIQQTEDALQLQKSHSRELQVLVHNYGMCVIHP